MLVTRLTTTSVQRFTLLGVIASVMIAMVLGGCQNLPTIVTLDDLYVPSAHSSYYIARLQQSQGELSSTWKLLAARALLQEGQVALATLQLQSLPRSLSLAQQQELQLLTAEIAMSKPDLLAVQRVLEQLTVSSMLASQQQRYYQLQHTLAKVQQDPIGELQALIALQPLLSQQAQLFNLEQTWHLLTALLPADQKNVSQHANQTTMHGWLALLEAYQDNSQDTKQIQSAITNWQLRYPTHPAVDRLPQEIVQRLNIQPLQLDKIGLLLPLSGKAAPLGLSILQGFLDAAQHTADGLQPRKPNAPLHDQLAVTPINADIAQIITYDSATQPLHTLLRKAKQDKISLLVGPLLKRDVEQLSSLKTPFPILALNLPVNLPTKPQKYPQRCYYGLSQTDEAQDAARHIWHQQKRHPLILVPQSHAGEQAAQSFKKAWQQFSQHIPAVHHFAAVDELKHAINHWSNNLATDEQPTENVKPKPDGATQHLGLTCTEHTIANSDHHIDAIYMVTTPEEFALLKSMVDIATADGAKRPTLYASSRSFQSTTGPDLRLEMEGLQFSDIPLLVSQQHQQINRHAAKIFNNDYSRIRLYAMGMDAWLLANHFRELNQLSHYKLSGVTGTLSADPQGTIHRQLPWVRYCQGQLVLLP